MGMKIDKNKWVYAIIQEPEKNPQYLGQHDEEKDVAYIPVFMEKDHALQCINMFKKDKSLKYEAQAVVFEELAKDAKENGFLALVLDGEGKVVDWAEL